MQTPGYPEQANTLLELAKEFKLADGRDADLEKIYRRLGFIPLTDDVGVEMTDNTILADVYPVEQINLQYFDSQLSWYYKNGSAYQDGLS